MTGWTTSLTPTNGCPAGTFEIDGATGSTYTLQSADLGKIIKVRVTFTDDSGNEETHRPARPPTLVEARPNSPVTARADHQRNRPGGPDPDGRHVWNLVC